MKHSSIQDLPNLFDHGTFRKEGDLEFVEEIPKSHFKINDAF